MNRNILNILFVVCSALVFVSAAYFAVDNISSASCPLGINGESFIALNKQSQKAKVTDPQKNSSLYYRFTANQKVHLQTIRARRQGAAVQIQIEFSPDAKKIQEDDTSFRYGFLYATPGDATGALKPGTQAVEGDFGRLSQAKKKTSFLLSLCVDGYGAMPDGFFFHGLLPYSIKEVQFVTASIGWDTRGGMPLFAFGPKGGNVTVLSRQSCDFSDGASVFAAQNGADGILPFITVGLQPLEDVGTWNNQKRLVLHYGAEELTLRRAQRQNHVTLQLSGLRAGYGVLSAEDGQQVTAMMLYPNTQDMLPNARGQVCMPLVTDLGMVMDWPRDKWRCADYELYAWEEVPHVLFFDFASYAVQNEFLTRLAYFVEKAGYKGTLVSDDFVREKHGYNAHDYRDVDLARFFTAAARQGFRLNERELLLRDILLANGIIVAQEDGYAPGFGAIVSFSRESSAALRWQFLAHESWHGIYFTNEAFRSFVAGVYNSFDRQSMEFLKSYWEVYPSLGYDRKDEYLMQNEFMAYLMQQGLGSIRNYFLSKTEWKTISAYRPQETAHVRDTQAQAFVDAGAALNQYAFDHFGFSAGRVHLVYRSIP